MLLEGCRIALIEDDPIMGESLVQRLSLEGARVEWFRSRAGAMKGLPASNANLVVCDLRLPDGAGEDVFKAFCNNPAAPPFLFMTAFADIDQAVRLMKSGAGDYLTKPFEMPVLLQRLQMLTLSPRIMAGGARLKDARGEAEKAQIERALSETGWKIGLAAQRLDVSRTTLWGRMRALGIVKPAERVQKSEQRDNGGSKI